MINFVESAWAEFFLRAVLFFTPLLFCMQFARSVRSRSNSGSNGIIVVGAIVYSGVVRCGLPRWGGGYSAYERCAQRVVCLTFFIDVHA